MQQASQKYKHLQPSAAIRRRSGELGSGWQIKRRTKTANVAFHCLWRQRTMFCASPHAANVQMARLRCPHRHCIPAWLNATSMCETRFRRTGANESPDTAREACSSCHAAAYCY